MEPVRLGRIGYVNVLPIYLPLENGQVSHQLRLESGSPAELNHRLERGELDISACSSIAYAQHPERYVLVPNLAIGSRGPVQSVLLLSKVPLSKLSGETILVSSQTHTSAALLRLLLVSQLGVAARYLAGDIPRFLEREERGELTPPPQDPNGPLMGQLGSEPAPPKALLAIGDQALRLRELDGYPYRWDLGQAWTQMTGLPFIFGLWVVRREAAGPAMDEAVATLLAAKQAGTGQLDAVAALAAGQLGWEEDPMREYFRGLCYDLGEWEMKGLRTFYAMLARARMIPRAPELLFHPCP